MTFFELQQLLKRYGTFIYTGDRLGDIDMMEDELKELRQMGFIEQKLYIEGLMMIKKERQIELEKRTN